MMCGIFAYAGRRPADRRHLTVAATGAARRGPHGHGWTARTPDGRTRVHHDLGPLDVTLPTLPADATAVVGHARLATVGRPDNHAGLQPMLVPSTRPAHAGPSHAVVHNGNVYNAAVLWPGAVTDSHALALTYAAARLDGMEPATAVKHVIERCVQHAWVVVVLDVDGRLYGHRRGHPLYSCGDDDGTYWSSQRCCPSARLLPELVPFTTGDL